MMLLCKKNYIIGGLLVLKRGDHYEAKNNHIGSHKIYKWEIKSKHPAIPVYYYSDEKLYEYFYSISEERIIKINNLKGI